MTVAAAAAVVIGEAGFNEAATFQSRKSFVLQRDLVPASVSLQ